MNESEMFNHQTIPIFFKIYDFTRDAHARLRLQLGKNVKMTNGLVFGFKSLYSW